MVLSADKDEEHDSGLDICNPDIALPYLDGLSDHVLSTSWRVNRSLIT